MNINSNRNDYLTSIIKSLTGAIPFAGSFISELITYIIPNQRTERVANFLLELNNRCNDIESRIKSDENKIFLIEEGIRLSSKTNSSEKREWFSSIISKGIIDKVSIDRVEKFLHTIDNIDNEQFIILYYYYKYTSRSCIDQEEFKNKYPDILKPMYLFKTNRTLANHNNGKLKYNTNVLINMGLLNYSIQTNSFSNKSFSGNDLEKFRDVYEKLNLVYKDIENIVNKSDFILTQFGKDTVEAILDPKIESYYQKNAI